VQRVSAAGQSAEYEAAATIDLHLFTSSAETRTTLWDLANLVQLEVFALAGSGAIDSVEWATRFGVMPYENPAVRRAFGSIVVISRAA
jgi:hypothetical protein